MEEHFDINHALLVYNKIVSDGEKDQDKYHYKDLTAWSDGNTYTVHMSDGIVTVSIYFHNKYDFDYQNDRQLTAFIDKLNAIDTKS